MNKNLTTKQKIVFATIESIEKSGIEKVTIRQIAREAKVNVAAINYHFSSKRNLLKVALEQTLDEAFINNMEEHFSGKEPYQAFLGFFLETFLGILRYPNITKAHFETPQSEDNFGLEVSKRFEHFLQELTEKAAPVLRNSYKREPQIAIVQMLSTIMLTALHPRLFVEFLGLDYKNQKEIKIYIKKIISKYIRKK